MDKLLSIDCTVEGDWQRLIQVFGNLLQNSIHYTDGGGRIEVLSQVVASGVEVTVHDSTPGVPEQEQQLLFERLYRVESSKSRATGGSGLGLARVKVCLRRLNQNNIAADPVTVDESRLVVKLHKYTICLTGIEFNIFRLLYDRPQRIFSRKILLTLFIMILGWFHI